MLWPSSESFLWCGSADGTTMYVFNEEWTNYPKFFMKYSLLILALLLNKTCCRPHLNSLARFNPWPTFAVNYRKSKSTNYLQLFSLLKQATWILHRYRICGNFCGLPIFAVFLGQYKSAKIKLAKYFAISVKEALLEATSIFATVTSSFPLLH